MVLKSYHFEVTVDDFFVFFRKTADMRSDAAGSIGLRVGPPRMAPFLMFCCDRFQG